MRLICVLAALCFAALWLALTPHQSQAQAQTPDASAPPTPVAMPKPPEQLQAWAYIAWWLPNSWHTDALAKLDRVLFFELKTDAQGMITERNGWPLQWSAMRQAAAQHNTPLDLVLALGDETILDPLFGNPDAMQTLRWQTVALAAEPGVHGIQLDFEVYGAVQPKALKNLRAFVPQLAAALAQLTPPRTLSVFYPIGADVPLYDAASLAQVEYVVLQGYDSHWLTDKIAGPVAPLSGPEAVTWEKALGQGLALGIARERLLLSFPLYGYEWQVKQPHPRAATLGKGDTATFAPIALDLLPDVRINVQDRVSLYGATHDPASGSSYYQFKNKDGIAVAGWFEDWWTLGRKSDYLTAERLGGIAFFPLGYDKGELVNFFLQRRGERAGRPGPVKPRPAEPAAAAPHS
jgi:spore germination protein